MSVLPFQTFTVIGFSTIFQIKIHVSMKRYCVIFHNGGHCSSCDHSPGFTVTEETQEAWHLTFHCHAKADANLGRGISLYMNSILYKLNCCICSIKRRNSETSAVKQIMTKLFSDLHSSCHFEFVMKVKVCIECMKKQDNYRHRHLKTCANYVFVFSGFNYCHDHLSSFARRVTVS